MSSQVSNQLEEIHSMLASGHRSIRMERHTLVMWGLAAAFLIISAEMIFDRQNFEVMWQRILAMNVYISAVLVAVGVCENMMTKRIRRQRDETISFVQQQLTKVWWLLIALIVAINIGMNFFGGGYLFYGITIILMGLALYIHGLFSQQMLTWAGVMMIIMGLVTTALLPSFLAQKALAASVFGIGLPALAWIIDRKDFGVNKQSLVASVAWLAAVILPAFAGYHLVMNKNINNELNDLPVISWEAYTQQAEIPTDAVQIVQLPEGTAVPVRLTITSELLAEDSVVEFPLKPSSPVLLTMKNGEAEGRYRNGDGRWIRYYGIRDLETETVVSDPQGPRVDMNFNLFEVR